jgi:hypothetical protein
VSGWHSALPVSLVCLYGSVLVCLYGSVLEALLVVQLWRCRALSLSGGLVERLWRRACCGERTPLRQL